MVIGLTFPGCTGRAARILLRARP